jgi:inhibitor of the pro-sigma K processing machinery
MTEIILVTLFAAVIVFIMIKLFRSPLKGAAKVFINTALGFGALILIDLASGFTGIALGVNLVNSIVVGVLGVPGFGMLLMLRLMFI